jgi:hypothetical protein
MCYNIDVTFSGKLFPERAASTEETRSPNAWRRVAGLRGQDLMPSEDVFHSECKQYVAFHQSNKYGPDTWKRERQLWTSSVLQHTAGGLWSSGVMCSRRTTSNTSRAALTAAGRAEGPVCLRGLPSRSRTVPKVLVGFRVAQTDKKYSQRCFCCKWRSFSTCLPPNHK